MKSHYSDYKTKPMFNKQSLVSIFSSLLVTVLWSSCAGTIKTVKQFPENIRYQKTYIVSAQNSQYINFKFGIITPFTYIALPDDPARPHEVIGNTDEVIKSELEKHGIQATIGKKNDVPEGYDMIVLYQDTWRWDMKKVLDKLEIIFISSDGKTELARSTYKIHKSKEFHNFPSPKKEVPRMIKEILSKK